MTRYLSIFRSALLLVLPILTVSTTVPILRAAEEVTVQLKSGRSFTGFVDSQTNGEKLILRFEGAATTLWRPILWDRIVGARYQAQELALAEFKELALRIKSKRSAIEPAALDAASDQGDRGGKSMASQVHQALAASSTVRSVSIDASAVNWDSDVELDGLLVRVFPLDDYGQVIPVQGSVNLQLIGHRPETSRSKYVSHRGQQFPQIGRWTRQVQAGGEVSEGAIFRLPFQAMHPEFRHDLASHGVVHAQLVVPGHGVFETSVNLVRMRPFSPTRDQLQQLTGRRFFAGEQLGRTR